MKKYIILIASVFFSLMGNADAYVNFIFSDAENIITGTLDNHRLDPSSVTLQGNNWSIGGATGALAALVAALQARANNVDASTTTGIWTTSPTITGTWLIRSSLTLTGLLSYTSSPVTGLPLPDGTFISSPPWASFKSPAVQPLNMGNYIIESASTVYLTGNGATNYIAIVISNEHTLPSYASTATIRFRISNGAGGSGNNRSACDIFAGEVSNDGANSAIGFATNIGASTQMLVTAYIGQSFAVFGTTPVRAEGHVNALEAVGNCDVTGVFTAGTKTFKILDPTDEDNWLYHGTLEGPEFGVYYRGTAQLSGGEAEVALPSYFEALTSENDRTVQLTCVGGYSEIYVESSPANGKFKVKLAKGNQNQQFYWQVTARRNDPGVQNLQDGMTDSDGVMTPSIPIDREATRATKAMGGQFKDATKNSIKEQMKENRRRK